MGHLECSNTLLILLSMEWGWVLEIADFKYLGLEPDAYCSAIQVQFDAACSEEPV